VRVWHPDLSEALQVMRFGEGHAMVWALLAFVGPDAGVRLAAGGQDGDVKVRGDKCVSRFRAVTFISR
jgi:hypothetical protein